jgi:acyl-CoA synthetase (AMP-forming)/AMP-acid ligase II
VRLHDNFEFHARFRGDTIFAIHGERRLTYREANAAANRMAHALVEAGIVDGARFCWLSRNGLEMAVMFFAAAKVGAVPVPLNWRLTPHELEHIISDSGARLLISEGRFAEALGDLPGVRRIGFDGVPAGWGQLEDWTAGQPEHDPGRPVAEDAALYQMYTSGTTGRPKGAVLTHRSVTSNAAQSSAAMGLRGAAGDAMLLVMPLFHAGGASFLVGGSIVGATLVIHEEFDPHRFVDALEHHRIAIANTVPAMLQACLSKVEDLERRDFSSLRCMIYGASAITEGALRAAMAAFRCEFQQGYGQTESSAVLTFLSPQDHRLALEGGRPELLLSAGRAVAGTELAIIDEDGRRLPPGQTGEIVARGPQLMAGYWNLPEATAETLKDGWLHTGDVGMLDVDGYLFIQDRVKDMIVSGGENVYPREVENVLHDHPAVAEAAVIGAPDERWGETVLAVLVLKTGATLDEAEMTRFCRQRLAGFKLPRRFAVVDTLPRNGAGKVLKRELRTPPPTE